MPLMLSAALGLAYAATSMLGGAGGVAVLSGSDPGGDSAALVGIAYAGAYFGTVVFAPPLAALGLMGLLARLRGLRARASLRRDERPEAN